MPSQLKTKAYAKINLSLKILGTRPDGYHNIDSIFQSISLYDEISITLLDTPGIEIVCSHPDVPCGERNIVYKAIKALPVVKTGVRIEIKKQIPVGAGLGGGSSNAAAVLLGLNQLWELGLSILELQKIGAKVGADVPFCLVGGTARVTGIGDIIEKIDPILQGHIVIVKPDFAVSTAWAYENYDKSKHGKFYNDLEPVVVAKYPQIAQIKQQLTDLGASRAMMSGSGSAVFGVFDREVKAQKALKSFKSAYSDLFLVTPL
ncbi:MAG: 4-(cytidine 5'-diphospho)-2-C-methyl-D-erythritol kinase [Candidatus Saganbacteria bacterium]|nr:4-(cytidine 5'-diphospho)-2-C-methyl-D-erythritol kinase [Candidatus Saganbacteria bacterium]